MSRVRKPEEEGKSEGARFLEDGIAAGNAGEFEEARRLFEEALTWASRQGDGDLWDRAYCNRSVVDLELGAIGSGVGELRRIVLRNPVGETGFLAAYTVARAYEKRGDFDRALFYARIARDRAMRLKRPSWLSWSHNQLANLRLAQSYFSEACADYELALKLMPIEPSVARALILDNLGYCRFVQGRYSEGFGLLFECLRTLHRFGAARFEPSARLTLAFGYLEIGKLRPARRHALRALRLGDELGDTTTYKKSHFVLGEICHQLGEVEEARGYFTALQQNFYPEAVHAPELLMAIDVSGLINLKA